MITYHHDVVQGTDEWYDIRHCRVTGSNAITLLTRGVSAAMNNNNVSSCTSGYWANRGIDLEPEAIRLYEMLNITVISRVGFVTNSEYSIAGFSPDGVDMVNSILIEVKCFKHNKHGSINTVSDIPIEVMAQIQFGLLITGLKYCDLILYNPDHGDNIKIITVKRVKKIIERIKSLLTYG